MYYKCSVSECENNSVNYFCSEHTEFLIENRTYKVTICKTCGCIIRFEKSDKLVVLSEEECKICEEYPF